jgi:ABC-type polysaccharide/polyol phosphate export permease
LGIFIRDIKSVLPTALQALVLLTPVAYTVDQLPAGLRQLSRANPMATYVLSFRSGILEGTVPTLQEWARSGALTAAIFGAGLWYFHRTEGRFADVA